MTFASGGNHGIFIFAKFFVRCGHWRRKEHIRGKRSSRPRPTHSSGLFSPFLFGISLIFWNIFGVYASTPVNTMNNSSSYNNSTHSTSKIITTTKYTGRPTTTTTQNAEASPTNCVKDSTSSCNNISTGRPTKSPQDESPPPCDMDFSVCDENHHRDFKTRLRATCESYTCQYNDGDCLAKKCLNRQPTSACKKCLCESRDIDNKTNEYFEKFKGILSRVDCKKPYSMWNCTHCSAVYKNWLCAIHGLYNNANDTNKPCLGMCTSVMSHCPYLVPHKLYGGSPSFQCPKFSDLNSKDSYASDGECFVCNEPESRNYNNSTECYLNYTMATSGSKRIAAKFVLLIWLVFMMRISVYFNTASYL